MSSSLWSSRRRTSRGTCHRGTDRPQRDDYPIYAEYRFSDAHSFVKPNDKAALDLMDRAAQHVMSELPDVVLGFGESDEYS